MSEDSRRTVLQISADDQTKPAFDSIKQGARDMAQAVQQAGQQAAQGMQGVSSATQIFTQVQSKFVDQVRRTTILKTEGQAALLEYRGALLGVSQEVAPFIEKLRQAEAAQRGVAASVDKTGQALRLVSPQITDIVTGLVSGQAPLTVFVQQGGQLKDVFQQAGLGFGAAARAVVGMINPMVLGAAAIAAVAIGASKGAAEMRDFQNAVTLSGNVVGLSVSQFTQLRDALAGIAGTKGKAAEVLTEIAASGLAAGRNVRAIAEAAVLMERATGTSIGKTIDQFKDLEKAPSDAAKKLNEQLNFLTASLFAQIKALEEEGKKAEAADLAERALADTLKQRAAGVVENVGSIEKAWRFVRDAAKGAWDAMLGIGRDLSPAERLADAAAKAAQAQAALAGRNTFGETAGGAAFGRPGGVSRAGLQQRLDAAQQEMRDAFRATEIQDGNAASAALSKQLNQDRIDAFNAVVKSEEQHASAQTKLNKALEDFHRELDKLRAIPEAERSPAIRKALDPAAIARTEQGIRDQFRQTGGESDLSEVRAREAVRSQELARMQQALATLDFSKPTKLSDEEVKVIGLNEKLKTSLDAVTRARTQQALAEAQANVENAKTKQLVQDQIDLTRKAVETITNQADAASKQADSIRQQAEQQKAANDQFGKSKIAIAEATLAQLQLNLAQREGFDPSGPEKARAEADRYTASLRQVVEEQKAFVAELQRTAFLQENQKLDEQGRQIQEDTQSLQLEISLLGRSREERERIIAQRKVEVELAKELAEIDKGGGTDEAKEQLRAKARANAQQKEELAAQKVVLDEWQRTADSINQSLTDALLRGFESGKGFAQNFRDTLKNMFATLILQPTIKSILSPVAGDLAAAGQAIGGAITGGGGSALGGLGGSIAGVLLPGGVISGLGMFGQAAGVTLSNGLIGGFGANMANIGTLAGAGQFAGALGAAAPYIGIAVAAASALGLFDHGGPKTESGFGPGVPLRGDPSTSKAIVDGILAQYKAIAGGLAKDLQVGVFTAQDPQGTAKTQLAVNAILNGQTISNRGARLGGIENVGRSPEELQAAITQESERVILHALAATKLPDKIGDYLRQLGDIDKLSGGALDAAVQKLQKAMTERQTLEAQLFDLTHTDLEKVAEARRKEREALDETNRALYDHVAALTDLRAAQSKAQDDLLNAFQRESDTLRSTVEKNQNFAQQLREFRDSLTPEAALSPAQRRALATGKFDATLSGAISGDESALQNIAGTSKDFLDAVRATARTPVDVVAAVAKVQAGLTTAAASADGRAGTAQKQLDAMTQQLSALGLINTSVLSVGEALGAYLKAQTAIDQENLRYTAQLASEQATSAAAIAAAAVVAAAASGPAAAANTTFAQFLQGSIHNPSNDPGFLDRGGGGAATGGFRTTGAVMVGELGREVVDFDTPGRVYTADQTRGMFANRSEELSVMREVSNKLDLVIDSIRRGDVAHLQQLTTVAAKLKKFDNDGMPPVRV